MCIGFRPIYYFFLSSFFEVSYIIGEAINKDEYVPTTTPTINANINPLIESPPNKKIAINTTNVVKEVLIVLPSVLLNAVFTIFEDFQESCKLSNSRILSKITKLSFNE